ncbi:MAG: serine--tRNA ligase [Saprospiraceae bacterium]|nr:serine--tRNA ligase [Bacteroidia bacterium]NNF22437.1 serine--tRNA ligase [Saprospiraceae bacterium]
MLEINKIRDNRAELVISLKKRGWSEDKMDIIRQLIDSDDERKKLQTGNDALLARRNSLSREIGQLFKDGKAEEANKAKKEVESLKLSIQEGELQLQNCKRKIEEILLVLPNIAHSSVPDGQDDSDNEIVKDWTEEMPALHSNALPHWEIGKKYNVLDFELGVKLTGAGFPVYINKGARLERALINFFLDEGRKEGYTEIIPPLMVNADTARATGQLPDKEGQMYHMEKDELYMIPTAEVPLTNIYRDVIVKSEEFPIKLTGYTPCFRREAGSYGADVKGLNRVHQFDKIEIVQVQHPDKSYETLDQMVRYVEGLLQKLELPYRILRLCGGDLGFTSALTYDFEVFSAAQKRWLEVSSVSNFETFQSNRLKLRFKNDSGKTQLAHTLNGSALALARVVAALLENNQTEEGVVIPEVLRSYTGFDILN